MAFSRLIPFLCPRTCWSFGLLLIDNSAGLPNEKTTDNRMRDPCCNRMELVWCNTERFSTSGWHDRKKRRGEQGCVKSTGNQLPLFHKVACKQEKILPFLVEGFLSICLLWKMVPHFVVEFPSALNLFYHSRLLSMGRTTMQERRHKSFSHVNAAIPQHQ